MIDAIESAPNRPGAEPSPNEAFNAFVEGVEPSLRRALAGAVGIERAHDATAEALAWAWENWDAVAVMKNPAGYLYRVARSKVRVRFPKRVRYLVVDQTTMPHIEPGLPDAIRSLPVQQRTAVWLVYACDWSYAEVAEAMEISTSAVGTHASRGLAKLRATIGEDHG